MNTTVILKPKDKEKTESLGITGEIVHNSLNEVIMHPFYSQYKSVNINNNSAEILTKDDDIICCEFFGQRLWNYECEAQIASFECNNCLYINAFAKQNIIKRHPGNWLKIPKDERGMIFVYSPSVQIAKMTAEFYYKNGRWNVEFTSSNQNTKIDISDEGLFSKHFYRVYAVSDGEYELDEINVVRE